MTPALYASLSDRQVLDCYLAPRDDDGHLVPEAKRRGAGGRKRAPTGAPDRAAAELPTAESLQIPAEVWAYGVPADYTAAWWQVWRSRPGQTTEGLLERWRSEMSKYGRTAA